MKIAVCDDCYEDALYLKTFLDKHETVVYKNAVLLLQDIQAYKLHYDLYLIDIYLDETMDGIELAKQLQSLDNEPVICFISISDAFYREAYDLYAVQYLLKPVQKEALDQLIDRINRNQIRNHGQCLSYKWAGQSGSIPYGKILFISSSEHTLYIHCKDHTIQKSRGKLNLLAEGICGDVFIRCHQSFIINMVHVNRREGNELIIGGFRIPISRRYYAEVKKKYHDMLFEGVE